MGISSCLNMNQQVSAWDNRKLPVAVLVKLLGTGRVTLLALEMLLVTWRRGDSVN